MKRKNWAIIGRVRRARQRRRAVGAILIRLIMSRAERRSEEKTRKWIEGRKEIRARRVLLTMTNETRWLALSCSRVVRSGSENAYAVELWDLTTCHTYRAYLVEYTYKGRRGVVLSSAILQSQYHALAGEDALSSMKHAAESAIIFD